MNWITGIDFQFLLYSTWCKKAKKDLRTLILLLYSNNSSVICKKRFITKNKYTKTFKYEALFIYKKKILP